MPELGETGLRILKRFLILITRAALNLSTAIFAICKKNCMGGYSSLNVRHLNIIQVGKHRLVNDKHSQKAVSVARIKRLIDYE